MIVLSFPKYFFIYFWLCWVFVPAWAFSSCGEHGATFHWGVLAFRCEGFSSCRASVVSCSTQVPQLWLAGSRAQAKLFWHVGSVAPGYVGSSWTRDQPPGSPVMAGGFSLHHQGSPKPVIRSNKFSSVVLSFKYSIVFKHFFLSKTQFEWFK